MSPTERAIEAVWRIESAPIVATLARMLRDVGLAEELAQDALVAALEQWPAAGVPDNPGAWLTAVAKHRALDRLRRGKLLESKHEELGRELDARHAMAEADFAEAVDAALDDDIGDDLLRLVFTACHPVLATEARVAIPACHARARSAEQTDWPRIAALYDALAQLAPSPVVELNREARAEFERAASLTRNVRERELLLARAAGCKPD